MGNAVLYPGMVSVSSDTWYRTVYMIVRSTCTIIRDYIQDTCIGTFTRRAAVSVLYSTQRSMVVVVVVMNSTAIPLRASRLYQYNNYYAVET